MNTELSLLYPEWQSYGVSTSVYEGALTLAESLFDPSNMVTIDVEWPVWADAKLAERITNEKGENHG